MAFDFQALKYVDPKAQDIVFGYLKQINQNNIIPALVSNACLLYYYQYEYFAVVAHGEPDSINCSNDNKTISLNPGGWASCYGNICIKSTSERICKWSIKVEGDEHAKFVVLGISADDSDQKTLFYNTENSYSRTGDKGLLLWTNGDIIDMILDLKHATLEFCCNGISQGISHKNIKVDDNISYKMAVCFDYNGQSATLEWFQWIY